MEETGTVEVRRDLSISYNKLGNICHAEGRLDAAEEYYQKDLKLSEQLAEETGTVESYDDLAISYYKLGVLNEEKPDSKYFRHAYAIWERLSEIRPDNSVFVQRQDIVRELLESCDDEEADL